MIRHIRIANDKANSIVWRLSLILCCWALFVCVSVSMHKLVCVQATVSIGVIAGEKVKHDKLALFYWDAFSSSWAELTGSAYNKDLKIVQGMYTFSLRANTRTHAHTHMFTYTHPQTYTSSHFTCI